MNRQTARCRGGVVVRHGGVGIGRCKAGRRRIWIQQFCREITGGRQEVRRREKLPQGDGLPPGRDLLISPYDLDARYSIKRDYGWGGYKVHFTGTCDDPGKRASASAEEGPAPGAGVRRGDRPDLVTNVATTEAAVPDSAMTTPVHQQLEDRHLLPGEHLAGSGYPPADQVIHAARFFGITLVSPMLLDTSAQARAGAGYDKAAFAIDFDARQATCPQGGHQQFPEPVPATPGRGDRGVLAEERRGVQFWHRPGWTCGRRSLRPSLLIAIRRPDGIRQLQWATGWRA